MEVKYYKDFRNNYLILKSQETKENTYQCKMITENRISGFLPCKERHINGEKLLYYDISSKQSLQKLFAKSLVLKQSSRKSTGRLRKQSLQQRALTVSGMV